MKTIISRLSLPEFKTQVAYTGKKLSTCFNVKDQYKFDHQHVKECYADCSNERCRENFIDESGHRISERIKDHNGRDFKSHSWKTYLET